MGRIIRPSEIQTQVNTMIFAVEKDSKMLQEALIEAQAFSETVELQGDAWTGMKNQISAHDTVIRGLICMIEILIEAGKKLAIESGVEDLNEDELMDQIREMKWNRRSYSNTIKSYQSWLRSDIYEICLGWYARSQISSYRRLINITDKKIRMADEKLKNIDYIDTATRNLTVNVENIKQSVKQGLEYLSSSWIGKGYAPAAGRNLKWMTTLDKLWDERTVETALPPDEKIVLDKLEEDYKAGKINAEVFNSVKSGILSTGVGFLQNIITQKVSDVGAETIANAIYTWLKENTTAFIDRGLAGSLISGGDYLVQETPTLLTQVVRASTKYAVPIIGTAIDYGIQRASGENAVDAGIKATAHMVIGIGAAKTGMIVGAAIGSTLGPLGTVAGATVGVFIGAAGSMIFDWAYDNKDKIADEVKKAEKKAKKALEDVGDTVSGFFSGVAGAFT